VKGTVSLGRLWIKFRNDLGLPDSLAGQVETALDDRWGTGNQPTIQHFARGRRSSEVP
jgi:hypothetical protein